MRRGQARTRSIYDTLDALTMADNIMTFRTVVEIPWSVAFTPTSCPSPWPTRPVPACTRTEPVQASSSAFYEAGQGVQHVPDRPPVRQPASVPCGRNLRSHRPARSTRTSACGAVTRHQATSAGATATVPRCLRIRSTKPGKEEQLRAHGVPCARPVPTRAAPTRCCWPPVSTVSISRCGWASLPVMTCGELTDGERQAMGIQPLPRSLDIMKIMEKSDFVADVLGEHASATSWTTSTRNGRVQPAGHALRAESICRSCNRKRCTCAKPRR